MANALYQQGTQRIEIIVRKDAGSSDIGAKEVQAEEVSEKNNGSSTLAALTGSTNVSRQKRVIKTNLTHAWAVAQQVGNLAINYQLTGIAYKNGDQATQDIIQRNVEKVQDVNSFASSVAMGAVYGSWGGPIGAALGAAFGAISTSASLITKYKGRERDYDYKIFKEQNAIEYNRARAGINLTSGRLR